MADIKISTAIADILKSGEELNIVDDGDTWKIYSVKRTLVAEYGNSGTAFSMDMWGKPIKKDHNS